MQFRTIGIVLLVLLVTQCMYEVSARNKEGRRRTTRRPSSTRRTTTTHRPSTTHHPETHKNKTKLGDEIAELLKEMRDRRHNNTNLQKQGDGTSNQGRQDKIIINNNGPPGSVTTANVGSGTTVINTNTAQQCPPAAASGSLPQPALPVAGVPPNAPAADPNAAPTAGGIICVPVRVPVADPKDSTKTIETENIMCYPAPPPETVLNDAVDGASVPTNTPSTAFVQANSEQPTAPTIPKGSVPLAPFVAGNQPDILKMPCKVVQNQSSTSSN